MELLEQILSETLYFHEHLLSGTVDDYCIRATSACRVTTTLSGQHGCAARHGGAAVNMKLFVTKFSRKLQSKRAVHDCELPMIVNIRHTAPPN